MSLHDSKFFQPPLNDGNRNFVGTTSVIGDPITEVVDNNYGTSSSQSTIAVAIDTTGDGTGDAQEFDHVFLKSKRITSYEFTAIDGSAPHTMFASSMEDSIMNCEGMSINTKIDGFQHNLCLLYTSPSPRD